MQTAMAGLVEVQADMLTALAEEVDTQAAAIVTLTTEREYYRTAAENAQASTQAGWARAHALSAELRTAEHHIQTITRNETRYRELAHDYHVEKTRLAEELAARDAALAEATAACERLRAREGAAVDRLMAMGWQA